VPISIAMGALTRHQHVLSPQNMGAGRPERGPAYAWNALWIALAYWLVLLVPYGFALLVALRDQRDGCGAGAAGGAYGQVLVFGVDPDDVDAGGRRSTFYGMHRASVGDGRGRGRPTSSTCCSTSCSIFGSSGCRDGGGGVGGRDGDRDGRGAGDPDGVFLGAAAPQYATRSAWRLSWRHIRDLFRIGWPTG
jgi:hypothetical protein